MQPGERITVIKKVAEVLKEESLVDLKLTLRQFGFSTPDGGGGFVPVYDYVVECLEHGGSDSKLIAIYEHVLPGARADRGGLEEFDGLWREGNFRLFISHTHPNQALAGEIRSSLGRWGVDAFVAHDQIEPSQEWQKTIESALATCDALVALLTEDFVESNWCDQEVGFCLARGILIVPASLSLNPHGFIGKYQRLTIPDGTSGFVMAQQLFDLLATHDRTSAEMSKSIALRYAGSFSFDDARHNFDQLKGIPKELWTAEMAEIVENAAKQNNQVEHANLRGTGQPIPEAVTELLDSMLDRNNSDSEFAPSSDSSNYDEFAPTSDFVPSSDIEPSDEIPF